MASLKGSPSNDSLFDFFEDEKVRSKIQSLKSRSESKVITSTDDNKPSEAKEISLSIVSGITPKQEDVIRISTTPTRGRECGSPVKQRETSRASSVTDGHSTARESPASNYSSDFSSCCSSPVYDKSCASFHSAAENVENDVIEEKCDITADVTGNGSSMSKNEAQSPREDNSPRSGSQKSVSKTEHFAYYETSDNLVQNSENLELLEKTSNVSLERTELIQISTEEIIHKPSTSEDSEIGNVDVSVPDFSSKNIENDLKSQERIGDVKINKQETVSNNTTHPEGETEEAEENVEKDKIEDKKKEIRSSIENMSQINSETDDPQEKVRVETPIPHLRCDLSDLQKSLRQCFQNASFDKSEKEKKKTVNVGQTARTEKERSNQLQRNKQRGKKKVITPGTIASSNNNSRRNAKRNRKTTNDVSTEHSANDSVSEAVVNILKIGSTNYSADGFESHSDPMFMGCSSMSGHSFNSRYTTSIQNSPYNSSYGNNSQQKGRLSLPSINNTVPGQLIRATRGNSDSDISNAGQTKRKAVRNRGKTKTTDGQKAPQRLCDGGKPKIPIQLKAEAMLRNGKLEVFVNDKDDVQIGTDNLNVKITVVHKFVEAKRRAQANTKHRVGTRTQSRAITKANRDIIHQRALYPNFNTHTNQEASHRHYNRFA